MVIIGVTGGLGTGKSTVARMFADFGAHMINADEIARKCLAPQTPESAAVVEVFGQDILVDGRINRTRLAEIVFKDEAKLKQLEAIVHPFVRTETQRLFEDIRKKDPQGFIVWDVPLLFEKNLQKDANTVVVVDATEEQQIARAVQRLNITREDAVNRIQRQMPMKDKIERADFVVRNDGSLDHTRKQVKSIWKKLKKPSKVV